MRKDLYRDELRYLLIVPYGIETRYTFHFQCLLHSFNCTLWN